MNKKLSFFHPPDTGAKKISIFHPVRFLATGFASGRFPFLGGTVGSFVALLLAWPIHSFGNYALLIASILCTFLGVFICKLYLQAMPDNKDPKEVVIDEFAGMWLLLAVMPQSITAYFIAFILFRLFDIFKPYPVCVLDKKIVGAFGIMIDDIAAACYPIFLFVVYIWISGALGKPVNLDAIYSWLVNPNVF
jgi:phosphatidylglycerophosphatase A